MYCKTHVYLSFTLAAALSLSAAPQSPAGDSVKLRDRLDSLSYILGRDVGGQLKDFGAKIKMPPFTLGLNQAINGVPSLVDSTAANSIRKDFAARASEHMQKEQQVMSDKNTKLGDTFLTKNKKRPGVKTTKSGLQYTVVKKGNGPKPTASDSVLVEYKGMLIDSTVIDSSTAGQPVGFNLQRILPGLAEGISLMNAGSRYRFFIPPELAYGEQGAPPRVPPSSVLIFDVSLMKIAEKK